MVFIAVVLTLFICVLLDKFLRRDRAVVVAEAVPQMVGVPALEPVVWSGDFRFQCEFSYHPGHAWVWLESAGIARLGSDDFTGRLLGHIDAVELPPLGTVLRQGECAWDLHRAERSASVLAPLSGRVVAVNEQLRDDPDLVRRDPYGEGWLVAVAPHRLRGDLNGLLRGDLVRCWLELCTAQVRFYACRGGHLSMPEARGAVGDLGGLLSDMEWADLVRYSLRTDLGKRHVDVT